MLQFFLNSMVTVLIVCLLIERGYFINRNFHIAEKFTPL